MQKLFGLCSKVCWCVGIEISISHIATMSNKKIFFSVNIFEILHASTCTGIHIKSKKKMPRLVRGHQQPLRGSDEMGALARAIVTHYAVEGRKGRNNVTLLYV